MEGESSEVEFRVIIMLIIRQKSKEKNIAVEETRRRNEASIARKRANAANATSTATGVSSPEGSISAAGTGAMDTLLEKLRAAAPQARDQRDRRRRARLKDKHQVRVASGQKMPELEELTRRNDAEAGDDSRLLNPLSAVGEVSEIDNPAATSEGEDVADRAASMLLGLRGDAEGDGGGNANREGSLRVRRRRESADDERKTRRRRRTGANVSASSSTSSGLATGESANALDPSPIFEEPAAEAERGGAEEDNVGEGSAGGLATPSTIVSPPTPKGRETADDS